jgi:RecA/RadA recombinase
VTKVKINRFTARDMSILKLTSNIEPKDAIKRSLGELITAERENSISTSCKGFNKLLEYGVPPFKISEICGESGSGKTQLW